MIRKNLRRDRTGNDASPCCFAIDTRSSGQHYCRKIRPRHNVSDCCATICFKRGSKHRRQWLGCGNSIPRYVFQVLKMRWTLISIPRTLRDTQMDGGEPGCPNDYRSPLATSSRGPILRCTSPVLANSEVATALIEVRLVGHSGLDLPMLSFSHLTHHRYAGFQKLPLCG